MVQGGKLKVFKAKKSGGSQRRKAGSNKKATKGRKAYSAKARKTFGAKADDSTTKAINAKNEAMLSGRAVSAGSSFFLNELKEMGKSAIDDQNRDRTKLETKKSNKLTNRLKDQLQKLGKDI